MKIAIISLFTDPLFSLPSRARDKRLKPRGIYWTAAQRGRGGGRRKYFSCSCSALVDVFEKNEKKNKTTSVYRRAIMREKCQSCFNFEPMTLFVGPLSTELIQWNNKTFGTVPLVYQLYTGKFLASHAGVLWASSRGPVFFFIFSSCLHILDFL